MSTEQLDWGDATALVDFNVAPIADRYLRIPFADKDFESARMVGKLRKLPADTLVVLGEQFGAVDTEDGSLRANAYAISEMGRGRQESQHLVWFGQLMLDSKTQGERTELVAVKPMNARLATHEYQAGETLEQRLLDSQQRRLTFTSLGFYQDKLTSKVSLITKYEHGVNSADRIMWNREDMPSQEKVADVFAKAAETLAILHGEAAIAHGDPQPKNIASDLRGVRIIDLEDAQDFLNRRGDIDSIKARRLIEEDMKSFLLKLGGDYTDLVREYFAEPYVARMAASQLVPEYVQLLVEEVYEISQRPQETIPYLG
jgi:hypothetical protein